MPKTRVRSHIGADLEVRATGTSTPWSHFGAPRDQLVGAGKEVAEVLLELLEGKAQSEHLSEGLSGKFANDGIGSQRVRIAGEGLQGRAEGFRVRWLRVVSKSFSQVQEQHPRGLMQYRERG